MALLVADFGLVPELGIRCNGKTGFPGYQLDIRIGWDGSLNGIQEVNGSFRSSNACRFE